MTPEEQQEFVDVICHGIGEADLQAMESRGYHLEVVAVAKVLTKACDDLGKHFELDVIVAALEITLNDFSSLLDEEA